MRWLFPLLAALILSNQDDGNLSDEIFQLLAEGDENIDFHDKTDFIVLLGLTGSGKSTLAHYLFGDPNTLVGYEYLGQMLYSDAEGQIGDSGIVSFTLIPVLTIDSASGEAIVDCPGFADTRNSSFEIAASYFIKKVFDTSTSVKIVLTISHFGVSAGGDRRMLNDLLTNIIQLVSDIDKYSDSFSMVATKVTYNRNNDTQECTNIRLYLMKAVEDYKGLIDASQDPVEIQQIKNKIKVLSSLIDFPNKIAVFREPKDVGPISKYNDSLANKEYIKSIVLNGTEYVNTEIGDFEYALTAESEIFIRDVLYEEIDSKITTLLTLMTSQFVVKTEYMGDVSISVINFKQQMSNLYLSLMEVDFENVSRETLQQLVSKCLAYLNQVSNFLVKFNEFDNLLDQFDFFHTFTDNIDDPYVKWIQTFSKVKEWLTYLQNWYTTLLSVYNMTGTAQVQKNKNQQFDSDLLDITFTVSANNSNDFLWKIKSSEISEYPDLLDDLLSNNNYRFMLRDFIVRDANVILNLIRPNITCLNRVIYVRSNFISFQNDIVDHLNQDCMSKNISTINIIAFEKVFVDADLIARDTDVLIIASTWDVTNSVKIDISGSNGLERQPPKAADGSLTSVTADGTMGLPGNPGGILVGLSNIIKNRNLINIISNGGIGGRGQNGGNGANDISNPSYIKDQLDFEDKVEMDYDCNAKHYKCHRGDSRSHAGGEFFYNYEDIWKVENQSPGHGGKGGIGGVPGTITLTNLQNISDVAITLNNGTTGDYGIGGSGWQLQKIRSKCRTKVHANIFDTYYRCKVKNRTPRSQLFGPDNFSSLNYTDPYPRGNPNFEIIDNIIELKFYFLKQEFLFDVSPFIINLSNSTIILRYYNIRTILNEILILQLNIYKIKPYALNVYANTMIPVVQNWPSSTYDDKQVMVFVTATLSSIIWSAQMDNGTVFVTNLYSYVQVALKNIEDLNTLDMIQATENIKNTYAGTMSTNILEAQNYITNIVGSVFDGIFLDIQKSMDALVEEIEQLKENIEENIIKLQEKQRELRRNLFSRAIFGVINVAASALKLTGPAGTAAGIALGAASSISQPLIVGNVSIDGMHPTDLPKGIYNLLGDLEKLKQSRKLGHMDTIEFNCDSYVTIPSISDENISKANAIRSEASTIQDLTDLQAIQNIIDRSNDELIELYNGVDAHGDEDVELLVDNNKKIIKYAQNTQQIAGPLLDGMVKYKKDQKKLETIVDMIEQEEQSLQYLSDFQEAVYQVIMPMIDTLHQELGTLAEELNNQSSVSLVIERWQITQHINEMTYLIARYTEGFEVQADLVRYFNQLNEAANLVVTLFEQIQYYQEHIFFAGYIADLNQYGGGVIPENSQYKIELVDLKSAIISSNVRVQCNAILTSFKQQVFPFASLHLGYLNIPGNKFCEGDDQTVTNTITNIKTELDKIRNTIISGEDQYVHQSIFDSSHPSTPPFAVWDNNTFGTEINQLMMGKEIVLLAPIVGKKNAVKFNKIELKFTRTDGGPPEELENALKMFGVEQTHLGNSMYKCDDFVFIIRSEPLVIWYALDKFESGEPVDTNNIYSKLLKGDISLSPYAMWRFKLTERDVQSFGSLKPFTQSNINLELFGTGQYVEKDVEVCKSPLENYYDYYRPMVPQWVN